MVKCTNHLNGKLPLFFFNFVYLSNTHDPDVNAV